MSWMSGPRRRAVPGLVVAPAVVAAAGRVGRGAADPVARGVTDRAVERGRAEGPAAAARAAVGRVGGRAVEDDPEAGRVVVDGLAAADEAAAGGAAEAADGGAVAAAGASRVIGESR
jgi:hypothetical protein